MSINSTNTEISNYKLNIKDIFGSKFKVIIKKVKEKIDTTLSIKLKSGILYIAGSEIDIFVNDDGNIGFEGYTVGDNVLYLNGELKKETYNHDLETLTYVLTHKIQLKLLIKYLNNITIQFNKNKFLINHVMEKRGEKIVFSIFSPEFSKRKYNFYLQDGEIKSEFEDTSMNIDDLEESGLFNKIDIKFIENWLKGSEIELFKVHS